MIDSAAGSEELTAVDRDHADGLIESARLGMLAAPGTVMVMARRPGA